jgi:hypothetical protein
MPETVFDEGGDEPLLEFMPEAPEYPIPGVTSPSEQVSVPLVPSSGVERRPGHSVKIPLDRNQILVRLRRGLGRCLPSTGIRNTARHLARKHVSLISAIGGAAVGALAMWVFGVQPPPVARGDRPAAVPVETRPMPDAAAPVHNDSDSGATVADAAALQPPAPTPLAPTPPAVSGSATATTGNTSRARGPAVPRRMGYRGSVSFRSEPAGAQVSINGQEVGSTPLALDNLSVGSRAVRIEAPGYQAWSSAVQVVANRQTRITVQLEPEP